MYKNLLIKDIHHCSLLKIFNFQHCNVNYKLLINNIIFVSTHSFILFFLQLNNLYLPTFTRNITFIYIHLILNKISLEFKNNY